MKGIRDLLVSILDFRRSLVFLVGLAVFAFFGQVLGEHAFHFLRHNTAATWLFTAV